LDGCCGGCPPELGTLLENLQLASPRSTLDAQTFLDAVFPGAGSQVLGQLKSETAVK